VVVVFPAQFGHCTGGRCLLARREGRSPLSVLVVLLRNGADWPILLRRHANLAFLTDPDREVRARFDALRASSA
jgi:hypothetical protein